MKINMHVLQAVNIATSKEETRYYLKGVYLETEANGIRLTATDGHRLITSIQNWIEVDYVCKDKGIIPSTLLKKIKLSKKVKEAKLTIEGDTVNIEYNGASYSEKLIDGTFPEYKKVIPKECKKEVGQFNWEYLASFKKAAEIAHEGKSCYPVLHYNGNSEPSLIDLSRSDETTFKMVGVIMPMRDKCKNLEDISFSKWVHEDETSIQTKQAA